jgi:hypothetical protein
MDEENRAAPGGARLGHVKLHSAAAGNRVMRHVVTPRVLRGLHVAICVGFTNVQ